MPNTNSNTII